MALYEILGGSPTINFARKKSTATMEVSMYYASLQTLLYQLFPPARNVGGRLQVPLGTPLPGYSLLFPKSAAVTPFPDDLPLGYSMHGLARCKVTIQYETLTDEKDADANNNLVTHTLDVSGEFLTMPSTGLKWQGEAKAIPNDDLQAGKIIPQVEHSISWPDVLNVPYSAIRNCVGKVNSGNFFGAAAESLLFVGAQIEKTVNSHGKRTYKVDYRFSERLLKHKNQSVGWNHFFDPKTGNWRYLVTLKGGDKMYDDANFKTLFT
tara:strand:+ start:40479 stop:41273 length:795 start_codon:yes stop_codon:yes gene_type:complete